MKIKELKNKNILILGFGREGSDTLKFLKKLFPKKVIAVSDKNRAIARNLAGWKNIKLYLGNNYLKQLNNYDVIIKSPGVPVHLPEVEKSFKRGKITSQAEIFLDNCPGTIVGITGTKGKSTTAFWIYQVLKKGGLKARLVGNIGKPVLTSLLKAGKSDIFVYELSSHQLYNLKKSPRIAVLLNIYPEHMDYYKSFKEYASAKENITKNQTKKDCLIYNSEDRLVKKIAEKSKAKKIPIKGKYYELNKAAANALAKIFKVPTLKKFEFLPHRLEYAGKFRGIEFYNDSLSTVPETTIEALDFLGNSVETIVLGGYDRGLSFNGLAKRLAASSLKTIILFPSSGARIKKAIENYQKTKGAAFQYFFATNMKEAVRSAYQHTDKNKICLLSPASPSFGTFKDYADRGNQFKKFLKMLK